nr:MAG TPA: hypothetical protein [Caudoviricetes sp.]
MFSSFLSQYLSCCPHFLFLITLQRYKLFY